MLSQWKQQCLNTLDSSGLRGFFLHSHFPWWCVTGPPWSFVSLRCYVSHVGWTDRYRQRTEDRPVRLKGLHCLEACPTGQSTATHWWGTEENSTRVGNYHRPPSISKTRVNLAHSHSWFENLFWKPRKLKVSEEFQDVSAIVALYKE